MFALSDLVKIQIYVAHGEQSFPMSRGSFRYRDKISSRERLRVSVAEQSGARLSLSLHTEKYVAAGTITASYSGGMITFRTNIDLTSFPENINRIWITFPFSARHYYGCGETFSKFDLAGEKVRVWVAEHQNAGRITKKILRWKLRGARPKKTQDFGAYESYYAQPTAVTSDKWFMHIGTDCYSEFDFTKKDSVTVQIRENTEITFGGAENFPELSERLSSLLGRQSPLPDWVYDGVILGMQTGPKFIDEKLAQAKECGVPVAGVWSQDWCGCRKTGFGYQVMWNWQADDSLYPDLKERISAWKKDGIRFLGYINPFIAIEKNLYEEAHEKGYCVKDKNGKDYLVTITTFPASMVDLTNPRAWEWYKNLIKENMIGIGMGGWMADFGEYLPPDAVLYSGEDAQAVHNRWPALWAKLNREAIRECNAEGEVFFFTRAGYTGTIKESTMMWNGDQHVDWSMDDGLPSVIPASLSLAMSGYTLTHSDAGGYTTIMQMTRGKELLMRWEEMSAFSPLLRTHEGNQPLRNVQAYSSTELLNHLARCARLHTALKPYLLECQKSAAEKGIPVMRPLFYHYDEPKAYEESYEYLLGRSILVAPVLEEHADKRTVYLPDDKWIHLWTGDEYSGGTFTVEAPVGKIPVFVQKSAWPALHSLGSL